MEIITANEQLLDMKDNYFKGKLPKIKNSKIIFNGKNNFFFCDDSVVLSNSKIEFNGDNSIVFLSKNNHDYKLSVSLCNNSTIYIGKNNYFNGILNVILSEETNFFIGNHCLFSFDIWIRTADPHLIYAVEGKKRINLSKSVYIGDHVWIGQSVMILKGCQIDSGSIVGAGSIVSGKLIENNTIYAGNPAKLVKKRIFWDKACVHKWTKRDTQKSLKYSKFLNNSSNDVTQYIYSFNKKEQISYNLIENTLLSKSSVEKYEYLMKIYNNALKNRFVHMHPIKIAIKLNKKINNIKQSLKKIIKKNKETNKYLSSEKKG